MAPVAGRAGIGHKKLCKSVLVGAPREAAARARIWLFRQILMCMKRLDGSSVLGAVAARGPLSAECAYPGSFRQWTH